MDFTITLISVATMLAYAVPAYALMKVGLFKESTIPGIASILLYICTPVIIVHSFLQAEFNVDTLKSIIIFSLLAILVEIIMLGGAYLIIRKKREYLRLRIAAVSSALGNLGFFGIPILKSLFPNNPEVVIYSAVFSILLNFLAFTFGTLIMSGDRKYISIKKLFLNPGVIPMFVAIPLLVLNFSFPPKISEALDLIVKMSTPLCMFVLGMRLARMKLINIFNSAVTYISIFAKQLIMPFIAFLLTLVVPCDHITKTALIILSGCPVASVVLNISEIIGDGQEYAANSVLLGTILSIVTIPVITLLC